MKKSIPNASSSRWLAFGAGFSVLGFLLLGLVMESFDPRRDYLSFGSNFHVSVGGGGLFIFSNADAGPITGTIGTRFTKVTAIDFPFCYRHLQWSDGVKVWSLMIPAGLLAIPFLVLPLAWIGRLIIRVVRKQEIAETKQV